MADPTLKDDDPAEDAPGDAHPIDPPVGDDERYRLERKPRDAKDRASDEPTLPSNDASMNTKI